MPYIKQEDRLKYDAGINMLVSDIKINEATVGDLNYIITNIVKAYVGETPSYSAINDVIGILECAKLELYRRMAAPYEDKKISQNGDVYPYDY